MKNEMLKPTVAADAAAPSLPVELSGVKEALENGDGFWRSCSGCHETNEGYETGHYAYSNVLKCYLGGGCSECGGIGAVWDGADYGAMADAMHASMIASENVEAAQPDQFAAARNMVAQPDESAYALHLLVAAGHVAQATVAQALEIARMKPGIERRMSAAARDVLAERSRQVNEEGWTPEHDDKYRDHEMSCAAACYAMYTLAYPAGDPPPAWPWSADWWKPTTHRRNLEKAAALILGEMERIDRASQTDVKP